MEETIVEVSKKHPPRASASLPQGRRARHLRRPSGLARRHREHIQTYDIGHVDLLFATTAGTPISRNTFRTRNWLPAVQASGIDFGDCVRRP